LGNKNEKIISLVLTVLIIIIFSGCSLSTQGHSKRGGKGISRQEKLEITRGVIENFFIIEGFSVNAEIRDLDGNEKPDFVVDVITRDRNFHWEDAISLTSGVVCGCKDELGFSPDKIFLMHDGEVRMIDPDTFEKCCSYILSHDFNEEMTGFCLDEGFMVME
jgi:hypothetical protein